MSLTVSPVLSRDNADPRVRVMFIALVAACGVITALTAAAFWLSYAHLAGVAGQYGLGGSVARQWAWPATLDLFIVAGEVLMFVDSLKGRRGVWAIGLTVAGSCGSIGLNVAGVGTHAPFLAYVVAAVPPSAALLAFGALMHQVRQFVGTLPAGDEGQAVSPAVSPEPVPAVSPEPVPAVSPEPVPAAERVPAPVSPAAASVVPVPAQPVPAVSRPKAAVPAAVSPVRPAVRIRLDEPRDTGRSPKADVPADVLSNLTGVVRFLRETGHDETEIKAIVPTLPGHEGVKADSLKKAIARTR